MSKNTDLKTSFKSQTKGSETNYKLNPSGESYSDRHLQALLLSIIPSIEQKLYIDSLTTGWKREKARKSLKTDWQIKDTISVHETINYIMIEGDRTTYNILLPHFLNSDCKKNRRTRLQERYMAIELLMRYSDNLSDCCDFFSDKSKFSLRDTDLKKGILAWDMCQLIVIARIAYDAQYLTEKEAWKYLFQAYEVCKTEFSNWEEISKSILIGGGMKIGTKKWFNSSLNTATELLNNQENHNLK